MHVFISYQRFDISAAESLAAELARAGFPVFIDRQIRVGDSWDVSLERALEASFAVVPLWTTHSVNSRYVRLEARHGLHRQSLSPVLMSACQIPLEFSDIEYADLRSRTPGDAKHPEWSNLLSTLTTLQQRAATRAVNGQAQLFFHLGIKFLEGMNCPQNAVIALSWFKKAETAGHPQASEMIQRMADLA
ncbi:MAG: toll/interleukin-1 receptor domain-containing protein [Planctomycetaceae bacterium]|nr:toll/interleukin-1 receptor domain-containing protein [Planctomycetaceae bacterium]